MSKAGTGAVLSISGNWFCHGMTRGTTTSPVNFFFEASPVPGLEGDGLTSEGQQQPLDHDAWNGA